MGKSNRIRVARAETKYSAATTRNTKKKKGMSAKAATVIAALCALLLVVVLLGSALVANGVPMRLSTAMSSEHFRINGNMMSVYFRTEYQDFYSQYSSYMSYFSLDTSKPLKDQVFGESATGGYAYESSFLGTYEGTWFDYFMDQATEEAQQYLIYCEEAEKRGIELNDEDYASIDEQIELIKEAALTNGYTKSTYIANLYGKGVKERDVRRALELSTLASKCADEIRGELLDGITEGRIDDKYEADKLAFDLVDYSTYSFSVDYEQVAVEVLGSDYTDEDLASKADEVLAEYKKQVLDAKEKASQLAALTDAQKFLEFMLAEEVKDVFDTQYELLDLEDEDIPEKAVLDAIKDAMCAEVLADVLAEKTETTAPTHDHADESETTKVYDQTVTEAFAHELQTLKTDVFDSLNASKQSSVLDKATYVEEDEFMEWAFDEARKVGETKTIMEGDGSKSDDVKKEEGTFEATVYLLRKTRYLDEEKTRSVAYMVFDSTETAEEAMAAFKDGELTLERFEKIAEEYVAINHAVAEDYVKGNMNNTSFDDWLYGDDAKIGDCATIDMGNSSYLVGFYYEDGEVSWKVSVRDTLFSEDFEALYAELEAEHTVNVKERVLNRVPD